MTKILCIVTAGKGGQDERRACRLAERLDIPVTYYYIDRSKSRLAETRRLWQLLRSQKWDLIYQEGTGIAGGANLILAALIHKQEFLISSGDPIGGYFHTKYGPLVGSLFGLYEQLLYSTCTGFVGWTPYLTGVAMKLGAPNAVTVEGAVDRSVFKPYSEAEKLALREKYGLPKDHLVCGIAGSLNWVSRQSWCQGYELIQVLKQIKREDVSVLIVGDGNGRAYLEREIPDHLRSRVIFTGRVPEAQVVDTINIMDIGFVTQIMGRLGNYRLSTKLPEYLACGTAVAMSPIPGFYDYAAAAGWALPADHPASQKFHTCCAQWIDQLAWDEVNQRKQQALDVARQYFDYEVVSPKFRNFVYRLLDLDPQISLRPNHAELNLADQTAATTSG